MQHRTRRYALIAALGVCALPLLARAADWPLWGRTSARNMISDETKLPDSWEPGNFKENSEEIDMATTKNVKWIAKVGSQTYGNPTIAGGKVYIGTNNESPRDPNNKGDKGILQCYDEKTGEFLWQLAVPKLGTGKVSDWEFLGLCSSPAVEGDRIYVVTNRNEILCLTTAGLGKENVGPYVDEAKYKAGAGKPPATVGAKDADIVWRFDMREELGVFPHNITNCGPLILGDKIVVTTSNGVDWTHTNIPNPKAPSLVVVNKKTGEYIGEEDTGVSSRTLHSNWSSPAGGMVDGKEVIFHAGGDGFLYALSTEAEDKGDRKILKELWRFDCNPPHYRMKNGKPLKYATYDGPSEVIATPVFYKDRVYVPIGQDPEHGEGIGNFVCLDAKTGKPIWQFDKIQRSLSTPSIYNDLVFVADFSGFIHCLDANTGESYAKYDTKSHIWASTLVADGKVYIGTEDGDVVILSADKSLKELRKVDMKAPVYGSVIAANATIYITTQTHLYAVNGTQTARATYSAPKGAAARLRTVAHTPARFCSHPSHAQKRRALCPAENR